MHDPLVVAFDIRRPWPRRDPAYDAKPGEPRWSCGRMHANPDSPADCEAWARRRPAFPWWRPGSYSASWVLAGRGWYWPTMITVWHREPGGHDSGEICMHYLRRQDSEGRWHTRIERSWRWHIRHWKIQVHPAQALRRQLLTRCAWCGGRSRKRDAVNISHSWDGPRGHWWQGEPGLYHHECSAVQHAHAKCLCDQPDFGKDGGGWPRDYGRCQRCGKFRGWNSTPDEADRMLAALPAGSRIPADLRPALEAAWDERRRRKDGAA